MHSLYFSKNCLFLLKSGPFLLIESSYQNAIFIFVNLSLIFFNVSVFRELVCPSKSKLGCKFLIIFIILSSIFEKAFCFKKNLSLKLIV